MMDSTGVPLSQVKYLLKEELKGGLVAQAQVALQKTFPWDWAILWLGPVSVGYHSKPDSCYLIRRSDLK